LVPFMRMDPPYSEDEPSYNDLIELLNAIWEFWGEEGKGRERVGEFIQRVGLGNFLDAIGLEPRPEMVAHPRENPYVFYSAKKEAE
jgi:dissimilatory sulfite reductase alpha subunit